jgi:ribose 5-phosphate isomerase A
MSAAFMVLHGQERPDRLQICFFSAVLGQGTELNSGGTGNRRIAANTTAMNADNLKRQAASRALEFVRPGMRLGLGTGTTARHFVELLAERVRGGLSVVGVPTSDNTRADAERLGVPLTTLDETPELDMTVDGADEIAPDLSLIKGGGGALLREKIVAAASARMVVIADESKWVQVLGRFSLPIEVVPFGLTATKYAVEKAAAAAGSPGHTMLRRGNDGHPFVTDGGHFILDAALHRIDDPRSLAARLAMIPGVVEHGLFIDLARTAVISGPNGVRIVERT